MSRLFKWSGSDLPTQGPRWERAYSGPRWAYEIAKEASLYPSVIEPKLYAQAQSYAKLGGAYEAIGYSAQEASQKLYQEGKSFSGWSREVIFESLHKFQPGPEEARMLEPFQEATTFGGEEWAARWNKAALTNKYVKAVPHSQSLESLASQARSAGVFPEWSRRVAEESPILGKEISNLSKKGIASFTRTGFAPALKNMAKSASKIKGPLALGLGAVGLYALQPGSWFSGKDDNYNSIEGLQHGGYAQQMRRTLTDFGSGYTGYYRINVDDDEEVKTTKTRFNFFATALEKYGETVGTGHKRILIPKELISEEQLEEELGFIPVDIAIPEAGQTEDVSYRHPDNLYHLHHHGEAWTMHRDEHASSSMRIEKLSMQLGKGASFLEYTEEAVAGIPHIVTEGIPGAFYYLKGQLSDTASMAERLKEKLAPRFKQEVSTLVQESRSLPGRFSRFAKRQFANFKDRFSGFDDEYNTIEGLKHGGMAQQKRRELTDFGSGFRGVLSIPKILQGPARRAGMVAFAGTSEQALRLIGGQMKKEIPTLMRKGPKAIAGIEKQKTALNQLMGEMKRSPFQDTVLINPLGIKQQAKALGVEPSQYLKGTLSHERFHQMITETNMRDWIGEAKMKVPWSFKKQLSKAYKQEGKTIDKATLKEEYLAYSLTEKYAGKLDPKLFSEADKIHAEIAQKLGQQKSAATKRWHNYHQRSIKRASIISHRPGRGHTGTAGKIVQ